MVVAADLGVEVGVDTDGCGGLVPGEGRVLARVPLAGDVLIVGSLVGLDDAVGLFGLMLFVEVPKETGGAGGAVVVMVVVDISRKQ